MALFSRYSNPADAPAAEGARRKYIRATISCVGIASLLPLVFWGAEWHNHQKILQLRIYEGLLINLRLLLIIPFILIGALSFFLLSCNGIIRGRISPWYGLLLLIPFLLYQGLTQFSPPGFRKTFTGALAAKTTEREWNDFAQRVLADPPKWEDRPLMNLKTAKVTEELQQRIESDPLLGRLQLDRLSYVCVHEGSVLIEWGGAAASRWGLAISPDPEAPAATPSAFIQAGKVYPSVSLYLNPD